MTKFDESTVNQQNAFEQTYDDLKSRMFLDPSLTYFDNYVFPNGSMYKGQILVAREGEENETRQGYGI